MIEALVAIAIVGFVALGALLRKYAISTFIAFTLCVFIPRHLFEFGNYIPRTFSDISSPVVTVTTVGLVVTVAVLPAIASMPSGRTWPVLLASVAGLAIGLTFYWPATPDVHSGVTHFASATAAFLVGAHLGSRIGSSGPEAGTIAKFLAAVFAFELALCLYQLVAGSLDADRANGTFDHPAYIGKVAILYLVILLPLIRSSDRRVSSWAIAAVLMAVVVTGITVSRANIIGIVIAIAVWAVTLPRTGRISLRILVPVIVFIGLIPTVPELVARFTNDPRGGDRPALLEAGLRVLETHFWSGTGPNNYVLVARQTERIVDSTGYPVHNTFVLTIDELGVIPALLLTLPLFIALIVSLVRFLSKRPEAAAMSRSYLAMLAGLSVVAWTGWGVLQTPNLQLLYFVSGFALSTMLAKTPADSGSWDAPLLASNPNQESSHVENRNS